MPQKLLRRAPQPTAKEIGLLRGRLLKDKLYQIQEYGEPPSSEEAKRIHREPVDFTQGLDKPRGQMQTLLTQTAGCGGNARQ